MLTRRNRFGTAVVSESPTCDTVKVLTAAKQQIRIRLAFVDAPEKGQAFGQRAKQAMSELEFGKDVELRAPLN